MSRTSCIHQIFVCSCSDFHFRGFTRIVFVHPFLRLCSLFCDVRTFTKHLGVLIQSFMRYMRLYVDFLVFTRLCCVHVWTFMHCNGCSPVNDKESFTAPNSFKRFQISPHITFLQLNFVKPGWGPDPNWFMIRPSRAHTRVFPDQNYRVWKEVRAHYSVDDGLQMVWSEVDLVWKVWS